jgi:hypothetical protein
MAVTRTLLPLDECEKWIWDILPPTKDSGFEYVADEDKNFLSLIQTISMLTQNIIPVRKITGMRLVHMSTHNIRTQLWFYRPFI